MPSSVAQQIQNIQNNPGLLLPGIQPADDPGLPVVPVVRGGSATVGGYALNPSPQIVIDPGTGTALTVQVVDADPGDTSTVGNLQFSGRVDGVWSEPAILSSSDLANPVLALTHDRPGNAAAVVVYQSLNDGNLTSASDLTLSDKLSHTNLRYRYFDGTNWSSEQSITDEPFLDANPSISFNADGTGVAVWEHNTSNAPVAEDGSFSSTTQTIEASLWDPLTHTWSEPVTITTSAGDNTKPQAYVDPSGNAHVVWVSGNGDGTNTLLSSDYSDGWSSPAPVSITGLANGGSFGNVALGRDSRGQLNTLFSYRTIAADGSTDSRLYDLTAAGTIEQIDQDGNYSHLRTTNAPDGSLVAYWQLGTGTGNGVYASTLTRSSVNPSGAWSRPEPLSSTSDLTQSPSVAIDTDGTMQTLFYQSVPDGGTPDATDVEPQVGVDLAPGVNSSSVNVLPELTFSNGLHFSYQDTAATGTTASGAATITNRGQAATGITLNWYQGTPDDGTPLGTRHITLSPGHSYDFAAEFPVSSGDQTYSLEAISDSIEVDAAAVHITTAELSGLPDLSIGYVGNDVSGSHPGGSGVLDVQLLNNSTETVGPFDVTVYLGDPDFPQTNAVAVFTETLASVDPSGASLLIPITLPDTAGSYEYTVVADSGNAIAELIETNNTGQYYVSFLADPAVSNVAATLLNNTGVANVAVSGTISNLGAAAISPLPIDLELSRNGGDFVTVDTQTIASLDRNSITAVTFTTSGLAGDDIYRIAVDPSAETHDSNLSNNAGQATLAITGLPDLSVGPLALAAPNVRIGDAFTVSAVVSDTGTDDATNVLAELFAMDSVGNTLALGSQRIAQISAGSQATASFMFDTSTLSAGRSTLSIQVNRLHEIVVADEQTESATATLNVVSGTAALGNHATAESYYLVLSPDGNSTWIYLNRTGDNGPDFIIPKASTPALTFGPDAGGSSLIVDEINGSPIPDTGMSFAGAAGQSNRVQVFSDFSTADTASYNASTVTLNGHGFTYSNVTYLSLQMRGGGATITQLATSPATYLSLDGSNDTFNVAAGAYTFAYNALADEPGLTLNVAGGAAVDIASNPYAGSGAGLESFSAVNVATGGTFVVDSAAAHADRTILTSSGLTVGTGGHFDLKDNDLIFQTGNLNAVSALLTRGYAFGHWTGDGLSSSTAVANHGFSTALAAVPNGYAPGQTLFGGTNQPLFDGQPTGATDILVKYTYYGDANLDGKVDGSDYSRIDNGYRTSATGWFNGDFNDDNKIDGTDYTLIDNAFNSQGNLLTGVPAALIAAAPAPFGAVPISIHDRPQNRTAFAQRSADRFKFVPAAMLPATSGRSTRTARPCSAIGMFEVGDAGMSDVTHIVRAIESGNPGAARDLLPPVEDELRKLTARRMREKSLAQTLGPTVLVHEANGRLERCRCNAFCDSSSDTFTFRVRAHELVRRVNALRRRTSRDRATP